MFLYRLSRALLLLAAAAFGWLGLYALAFPETVLSSVDLKATSIDARTEVRATYGGLQLAFALGFLYTANNRKLFIGGVALLLLITLGLLCGRAFSYLAEGPPGRFTVFLAVFELTLLLPSAFIPLIQSHSTPDPQ